MTVARFLTQRVHASHAVQRKFSGCLSGLLQVPLPLAMSSDDYFGDEMNSAMLDAVDEIEKTQTDVQRAPLPVCPGPSPAPRASASAPADPQSDDYDMSFHFDEAELAHAETSALLKPVTGTNKSTPFRTSTNTFSGQSTLDGRIIPNSPRSARSAQTSGVRLRKTMVWDQTRFAESGRKRSMETGKGNGKASYRKAQATHEDDEDGDESQDEALDFEQFPAPEVRSM
jgi:ATP-dependent DNA helicase MPH1